MHTSGEEIGQKERQRNPFRILLKMRREAPEFRRCCFCLPLRRGLISWAYIKLALDVVASILLIYISAMLITLHVILLIQIFFLLTDAAFNIVLIVGGHLKSVNLLKAAYIYNIVSLVLLLLSCAWSTYQELRLALGLISINVSYRTILVISLPGLCVGFILVFVQIYFILLIYSEIQKLEEQSLEMQFTNTSTAEAQCTMHISTEGQEMSTGQRSDAIECTTSNDG